MREEPVSQRVTRTQASAVAFDPLPVRFEAAWQAGGVPHIEDYLGPAPGDGQMAEFRRRLFALVAIDLHYRWRSSPTETIASRAPTESTLDSSPPPLASASGRLSAALSVPRAAGRVAPVVDPRRVPGTPRLRRHAQSRRVSRTVPRHGPKVKRPPGPRRPVADGPVRLAPHAAKRRDAPGPRDWPGTVSRPSRREPAVLHGRGRGDPGRTRLRGAAPRRPSVCSAAGGGWQADPLPSRGDLPGARGTASPRRVRGFGEARAPAGWARSSRPGTAQCGGSSR